LIVQGPVDPLEAGMVGWLSIVLAFCHVLLSGDTAQVKIGIPIDGVRE